MTGPERKRNELKLDFDLEKNAIKKNKVGNLTRLKWYFVTKIVLAYCDKKLL